MSQESLESVLDSIQKTRSSNKLFRQLVKIRKVVDSPKVAKSVVVICQRGGMKSLLHCLHSSHRCVIDITLSIIGNCCIDPVGARHAWQYYIMKHIEDVRSRYEGDYDIEGRLLRIIGNICQFKEYKLDIIFHCSNNIKSVKKVLTEARDNNNVPEQTINMAIRCIRQLATRDSMEQLCCEFNVLKPLGLLLIAYEELPEWEEKHKNIIKNIIRTIYEYSKYKNYKTVLFLKEVRNEKENPDVFDAFDALSSKKVIKIAPNMIIKTIMNFSKVVHLISDLPVPRTCSQLMELLEGQKTVSDCAGEYFQYIQCICSLFDHPAYRCMQGVGASIPLLIRTIQDFTEVSHVTINCIILILNTFYKCKYNDSLIQQQLIFGIIPILVEKIETFVGINKNSNFSHKMERKRKYDCRRTILGIGTFKGYCSKSRLQDLMSTSPVSSDEEDYTLSLFRRLRRAPSPSSSSDSDACSSSSPSDDFLYMRSDSDSDDYSPICSEAEPEPQEFNSEMDVCVDVLDEVSNVTDDDEAEPEATSVNQNLIELKNRLLLDILRIMKLYASHEKSDYILLTQFTQQLINRDVLNILLRSSKFAGSTVNINSKLDSINVICRILENVNCLIPVIQSDFISTLHNLMTLQHSMACIKCFQLFYLGEQILLKICTLAQTDMGECEIMNKLRRGTNEVKQRIMITSPYIFRRKPFLYKLMIKFKGLDILTELLQSDNDLLRKESIKSLCTLASKELQISNPRKMVADFISLVVVDKYKLPKDCVQVVTFILDDGTSVRADRAFLSRKSDFFDRLFNGNFKEASENKIKLQNVKNDSLKCLLYLLHQCSGKSDTVNTDMNLELLLDVLLLSDRYLLVDLCAILTKSVELFHLTPATVPVIYKWSVDSGTDYLRVECIAFTLVAKVHDSERFTLFENLFQLNRSDKMAGDIHRLIMRFLGSWVSCDFQVVTLRN